MSFHTGIWLLLFCEDDLFNQRYHLYMTVNDWMVHYIELECNHLSMNWSQWQRQHGMHFACCWVTGTSYQSLSMESFDNSVVCAHWCFTSMDFKYSTWVCLETSNYCEKRPPLLRHHYVCEANRWSGITTEMSFPLMFPCFFCMQFPIYYWVAWRISHLKCSITQLAGMLNHDQWMHVLQ